MAASLWKTLPIVGDTDGSKYPHKTTEVKYQHCLFNILHFFDDGESTRFIHLQN